MASDPKRKLPPWEKGNRHCPPAGGVGKYGRGSRGAEGGAGSRPQGRGLPLLLGPEGEFRDLARIGPALAVAGLGYQLQVFLPRPQQGRRPAAGQFRRHHRVPSADPVYLGHGGEALRLVGRIEGSVERRQPVVGGPRPVVQIAGDGHQAGHVAAAGRQQDGDGAAARVAYQHQGAGLLACLQLVQSLVYGVDHLRREATVGPVALRTGRRAGLGVLAGAGQIGHLAFPLGQGQLQQQGRDGGGVGRGLAGIEPGQAIALDIHRQGFPLAECGGFVGAQGEGRSLQRAFLPLPGGCQVVGMVLPFAGRGEGGAGTQGQAEEDEAESVFHGHGVWRRAVRLKPDHCMETSLRRNRLARPGRIRRVLAKN